ncbi:hypothetical protein D9619_001217 [Psilocybe cf. subviscida]|uniref:F-box domain-containing protein n=1 Tax=Psilocybe cf. subviscida TaxID=2480587 RepID=A0A8H5F361_9AGAR|nr:hypothetical protein D9619_001217 [Psilocybe cf. subviscida]
MLPSLPQDIFVHILDSLDAQYISDSENSDIWHPGRVSTLRNITLTSRTLCAFAQPRLFAHIDFDVRRDAQSRAARLLRYFAQEEGDGANLPRNESKNRRIEAIRSFRLRDGRGASEIYIPKTHWKPDLSTPLGRLLALFVDAPYLRMFAYEGDLWTLAGAGELVGYQEYIYIMSSKPSLRVLALTNACDISIDVFFNLQSRRQSTTGVRTLHISNVTFISEGRARDSAECATASAITHPIEHLQFGRLNYAQFFDMLQIRYNSTASPPLVPPLPDTGTLFHRLRSLSVALSVVPEQMAALWNIVYGLRETLEHLQLRSYESISGT